MQENPSIALFVVPGENIDTPSPDGLIGDKFDYLYKAFVGNNWKVSVAIDVYSKDPWLRTAYSHYSLKVLFAWRVVLALLRFRWKISEIALILSTLNQSALYGTYMCLVKRVSPKVVLAIGASEVLNTVCRELSIPIVEIQHGMFFRSDLENYWPSRIYPDFFLTWDSHFSNLAMDVGVNSRVVGHPYAFKDLEAESTSKELGKYICVTLGRNSVDSEDPWGCFPVRLCEAIDGLIEFNLPVLIRLHPSIAARGLTSKKLSRWIKNRFGPVRVDNPREISLQETIRSSFVNVTWSSATWFEFALAGKSTLMVEKEYAEQFRVFASQLKFWESVNSPVEVFKSNYEFLDFVRSQKNSPSNVSTTKAQDVLRLISEITETYKPKP